MNPLIILNDSLKEMKTENIYSRFFVRTRNTLAGLVRLRRLAGWLAVWLSGCLADPQTLYPVIPNWIPERTHEP